MIFDRSEKKVIAGPLTIGGDAPVTKYKAESDGRTFWAYNGSEVFYEDERLYAAFDRIVELETRLTKVENIAKRALNAQDHLERGSTLHHDWVTLYG